MKFGNKSTTRGTSGVFLGLFLVATLIGCVATSENPKKLTIADAKGTTMATLKEIAEYVPSSAVVATEAPSETRSLVTCGEEDFGSWPGSITYTLTPETDVRSIARTIANEWQKRQGWSTSVSTDTARMLEIEVNSSEGYQYLVYAITSDDGKPHLRIAGFSPCVYVEGLERFDKF